jgi:hypothetical protein
MTEPDPPPDDAPPEQREYADEKQRHEGDTEPDTAIDTDGEVANPDRSQR